jgi:hypothetical protein
LFRFANQNKNPLEAEVLASAEFQPAIAEFDHPVEIELSKFLGSVVPGTNFAIGNGLGVAVMVETRSPLEIGPGEQAFVRLHDVRLDFSPRPRDESVTV